MIRVLDFDCIEKIYRRGTISGIDLFSWAEDAMRRKEEFQFPPKISLSQPNRNYFNIMPCLWEKENLAMVKVIARHLLHDSEKRSTMLGDLLLYEASTGILKALVDAEYITTLRTAAVAAHSAMLFTKKDFSVIGLIGLGNIMTECLSIILEKNPERNFYIKLYQYKDQAESFKKRFSEYRNIHFDICKTYSDVIRESELVISAVTNISENFCDDSCFAAGVTVIPIMTMGFQNCDLFFDKVFTDEIEQIRRFKYFNEFKSCTNIEDVLRGTAAGRTSNEERILCYNYGIAVQDLYFANQFLKQFATDGRDIEYQYCNKKYFM